MHKNDAGSIRMINKPRFCDSKICPEGVAWKNPTRIFPDVRGYPGICLHIFAHSVSDDPKGSNAKSGIKYSALFYAKKNPSTTHLWPFFGELRLHKKSAAIMPADFLDFSNEHIQTLHSFFRIDRCQASNFEELNLIPQTFLGQRHRLKPKQ